MTTETILVVGAITIAFAAFALTLWSAERLARDLQQESADQKSGCGPMMPTTTGG